MENKRGNLVVAMVALAYLAGRPAGACGLFALYCTVVAPSMKSTRELAALNDQYSLYWFEDNART